MVQKAQLLARIWTNLQSRPGGPLSMRFVIQPIMAAVLGIRAGIRDAKVEQPAFLWSIFTSPNRRRELFLSAWSDIAVIFCIAVTLDVVFQLIFFRQLFPVEALIVATALACIPYSLVRGPANRLYSSWSERCSRHRGGGENEASGSPDPETRRHIGEGKVRPDPP